MIKNPFRTKRIFIISPTSKIKLEIPFLRKIKHSYEKNFSLIKGKHYDNILIDELGYVNEGTFEKINKNEKYVVGVDLARKGKDYSIIIPIPKKKRKNDKISRKAK